MTLRGPLGAVALAAATLVLAACGGSDKADTTPSSSTGSNTLSVYSALPLNGDAATKAASTAIGNGAKLALAQANGKAGPFAVRYVGLDDTPNGTFDEGAVVENARRAVQDRSTIAYLGDASDVATKLSLPVLNEAGILQVAPTNQDVGLTRVDGAEVGEPDKYYPSGKRTYGRVIPNDFKQAEAQATYQQNEGCTSTYVLSDGEIPGNGIAKAVAAKLQGVGITVAGNDPIDLEDQDAATAIARKIKGSGANCVFFGGTPTPQAAALFRAIHEATPTVKLFGPSTLSTAAFAEELGSAGSVTHFTTPYLAPAKYPASAQKFFADYKKAYGIDPGPDAIYGYEAMNAVLQAVRDAGARGNDRQAVIDAFYGIRDRDSVLGQYSIDKNGDTTLNTYGSQRVENGKLVFDSVITTS